MRLTSSIVMVLWSVMNVGMTVWTQNSWIPFTEQSSAREIIQAVNNYEDSIQLTVIIPGLYATELTTENGRFTCLDLEGQAMKGRVGEPRIPVLRRLVEVPYGAEIELDYQPSNPIRLELSDWGYDHPLIPVQPRVPKRLAARGAGPFPIDARSYAQAEEFAGPIVRIQDDDYFRGQRLLVLEISPVTYAPLSNSITYVSEIRIRINFSEANYELTQSRAVRYSNAAYEQLLSEITVNHGAYRNFTFPPSTPIGYMVICSSSYNVALAPFVAWKKQCGYDVTVVDTPVGATTATIKNLILTAYQSWPNPPDYVLLVGDTDTIPAFYGDASGSATDNQYTELEGTGYWTPDVMIGRFPVRSAFDLQKIITKVMQFEQMTMPWSGYFKDSVWLASADHYSMVEGTHEWCYNNHVQPIDPTGNLYHPVYERLGGSTSDFSQNVNAGRGIVCFFGIGYGNGTGTSNIYFVQSNVAALTNTNRYGHILIFADGTNLYDQTTSFGERWLLEANKGSISYWGASGDTYWIEDDTQQREIFRCQHENLIHTMSAMCFMGLISVYNTGGAAAHYFDIYNLMGDPSADFRTRIPQSPTVSCAETTFCGEQNFRVTITVAGAARAGALVAISLDGSLLGAAYTNSSGVVDVHFTPSGLGTAVITVTGHNLVPVSTNLVITPAICGVLALNAEVYDCDDTVVATVIDDDLDTDPSTTQTIAVDISSTSEPSPETLTLTETGPNTGTFTGTIQTSTSQSGIGYLLLADGDTITAHYRDAACGCLPADSYDTAAACCVIIPTATLVPTQISPTTTPNVTPTPSCRHNGDVDFDHILTTTDAQLAFSIMLGIYHPTYEEHCAADCDGNSDITAGDAQGIFMASLGTGSCLHPLFTI